MLTCRACNHRRYVSIACASSFGRTCIKCGHDDRLGAVMKTEHDHLEAMLTALDASETCFERPHCRGFTGDWQITGKLGHVLADGDGFLLYVSTEQSSRR
jgi:hypothetical protein